MRAHTKEGPPEAVKYGVMTIGLVHVAFISRGARIVDAPARAGRSTAAAARTENMSMAGLSTEASKKTAADQG